MKRGLVSPVSGLSGGLAAAVAVGGGVKLSDLSNISWTAVPNFARVFDSVGRLGFSRR